jgi:DNA polymerase III epsilon subunit family exonuclease
MAVALQGSFDDLATPLHQVTFVVVDVETTGGSPAQCSLTEVAAARYRGGELLGTYQTLVRPDERIPPFITALTGISDAMVAEAPRVGEMLPSFLEFVGRSVLVGHNLRFDLSFLDHALVATGRDALTNPTVDTLALARRLVRDLVHNCKLGTLASTLGLPHQPSHRALTDVLATGDLLHALLERAGSFGILGLAELLDLPRLVGHPQAAKLRLTVRLPHRPGVYWFTDAAGHVLYVGTATDLRARVRSYFASDDRRTIGRLLRQLDHIHHQVCAGPLSAAVIEGRLIRAWSPPFNQPGRPRRAARTTAAPGRVEGAGTDGRPVRPRGRGRRRVWTAEQLGADPLALLAPLAERVAELSRQQRYEEAGAVRDEAESLRSLIRRHRLVESLRAAGRVVLEVDHEGQVVLDGGLWTGAGPCLVPACLHPVDLHPARLHPVDLHPADRCAADRGPDGLTDEEAGQERAIVAQWLGTHAGWVRVLEVGSPTGLTMSARPIPTLADLLAGRWGLGVEGPPAAVTGATGPMERADHQGPSMTEATQPAPSSADASWETRIRDCRTSAA